MEALLQAEAFRERADVLLHRPQHLRPHAHPHPHPQVEAFPEGADVLLQLLDQMRTSDETDGIFLKAIHLT